MKNLLRIGTLVLVFSLTSCVEDMPEPDGVEEQSSTPEIIEDDLDAGDN